MLRLMSFLAKAGRNRIILSLCLCAVFTFIALAGANKLYSPKTVCALPCHEVEHFYYDDPTHANQVGYKWVHCGGVYSWGTVTQYVLSQDNGPCCNNCPYYEGCYW